MGVAGTGASNLRTRSAKHRRLLKGKYFVVWKLLLLAALALVVWAWTRDIQSLLYFSLAASLFVVQVLLWWKLYLRELPVSVGKRDSQDLEDVADADLLMFVKPGQSPKSLWQSLGKSWQCNFITNRLLMDKSYIEACLSDNPKDIDVIYNGAQDIKSKLNVPVVGVGAMCASLILHADDTTSFLSKSKLSDVDVVSVAGWQTRAESVMKKLSQKRSFGGLGRDWASGYTPLLNHFATNLSLEVEHGAYQHMYLQTHSETLEQILQHLGQSRGASVALVGGTGSGKTSLGYALAERLLDPENRILQYHKVFALNASLIVSEAGRFGNLESLLLRIVSEASRSRNAILFFDDAHSFFTDQTGASDMSNVLLQIIKAGRVRLLFAMRPDDWQYLASKAGDIASSIHKLVVTEPDQGIVEKVLQDQALGIEAETKTTITHLAVKEAYQLSERYFTDQSFPGKGISLLRSASVNATDGWVLPETVQKTVEASIGVKVGTALPEEGDVLLNLEEHLHKYMINQHFAVSVVADALRRARSGVRNQQRPVGTFLFLGPTGVGKTELSKALARVYFGGLDKIIRVDMSEYSQKDSSSRMLESSAGGATFLSAVRQAPFSVVLLDEIEKASLEVMNLLLQMLDEGQLTDEDGRTVSFKDAIVIATSNAGADVIRSNIEHGQDLEEFSAGFVDQLIDSKQFKPELINRFDETVLFRPLDKSELSQVVGLLLDEVNQNLANQKIKVGLSEAAIEAIVEHGYDPRLGARPMRRMMQRTVENNVSKRLLAQELLPGDSLTLDVTDLDMKPAP